MRIAHFVQRYPPALGGAESYFRRLSQYHATAGDTVDVWTTTALDLTAFWTPRARSLPIGTEYEADVQVRRFGLWRMRGRRWLLKPLSLVPHRTWQCLTLPCNPIAPAMWREAGQRETHYDAVHATAFPYAFPIACGLRLARRLGIPFFLTPFLHLGDARTRRSYLSSPLRALLRTSDCVFVQTPSERDAVLDSGVEESRVVLQGLGVDPSECTGGSREAARRQWSVSPDEVVIGHLANNSVEKGTVDLLVAAERLWRSGRRFVLVLAGPEMPNFCRFYERFAPTGSIRRMGVLSDQGKRDFFAGIDVFALPSRSDSFGLVLLEAWANGVPNIAYRAGGVADVIRDERDGLLVNCGCIDRLATGIDRLIECRELRSRLGTAGRERLTRDYWWADKLSIVREAVLDRTGRQPTLPTRTRVNCAT
ncbi:MAG: glycosyltransferase family 4 protein [Gemmataceae bacterium]